MTDVQQESGGNDWYRCPHPRCGAEYRSEHARDLCCVSHLEDN